MTDSAVMRDARTERRILHVITDLGIGGAERMLVSLVPVLADQGFVATVLSLVPEGALAGRLREHGVAVHELEMRSRRPHPRAIARMLRLIRDQEPDLVQTWMYHADLLGGLAARVASKAPVVWGLHNSTLDPSRTKRSTRWVVRACAALSDLVPAKIVSCSDVGLSLHARQGYATHKLVSIPNGFDTNVLAPSAEHRHSVRAELGLGSNVVLVGQVARFDPQKDHQNFVQAAGRLAREAADAHFVLVGAGCEPENGMLAKWIADTGAAERFHLLGLRTDAPRFLAAFDIAVLSSAFGEAFPLVIGEAMACGVPCVATDVGDSARIIGDTGRIVPPGDAPALAGALRELLRLPASLRQALGIAARSRIVREFSLASTGARYAALYREILAARADG